MKKLVIILLILQPLINKITLKSGVSFDVYNELLSMLVFFMYLYQLLKRGKITSISLVFFTLLLYMVLTTFIKSTYPLGFFQIVIYSQWFFYFLYYHSLTIEEKHQTLYSLKKILDKTLLLVLIIAVFEIPFHKQFKDFLGIISHDRGIGGFYLVSFFGSGPSLANFMSLYIVFWYFYHYGFQELITKRDKRKLILAFVFLILSFSRKEVLFVFLFMLFFPFPYRSQLRKWMKKTIVFVGIFAGLFIYYIVFFSKANQVAFGDKYIRWRIAEKSHEILMDNLPWGSGIGTFGSRVSLMATDVYEKYNVGPEMLGYEVLNQTRGPIYDAFMFTFTTELGIGILIFMFFFFKLFEARVWDRNKYKGYCKNFLIVYFLGLSFFQPVLISSFGYLCAIFFALTINKISLLKFRTKYAKT
ncbi:hypothetical protein Q4512_03130 [Oceanihabitans sp. 2_MG-2023]|uniref:hypothetical protein n=1 Tax=Oceanihabitans sp. 2_MG-2023 TaxID=3062661 RepID=UPI0026E2030E|nr:hypothetical protein [Oceanihabitans sp. 2_MG-2023]MDO6595891.1 hypothetical protein [Oceanihabitans sp. 2_MG-2023]